MTEAVPGPSKGHGVKQEGDAFGFFDSLDILATIATQELKSKSEEKVRIEDFTFKCSIFHFVLVLSGTKSRQWR